MPDSVPPAPSSGPKRIRSLPDRAPASTWLPGTDAASYGGDMSWRRGIAVLWTLFGLIAIGEAFMLAVYLLAGGAFWPGITDVIRLTVLCGVFLSLWFGWSWTRWVLAVVAFFAGGRTIVLIIITSGHGANADYLTSSQLLGSVIFTGIMVALGALYLTLCAYLIFSVDVLAFTRHRRQEGRGWVVVPVGLLLGIYWLAMLGSDFALRRWLAGTCLPMERLAQSDVQAMVADWNPASLATVLDADVLQNWPAAGRENFMQAARSLGTYLGPGDEDAGAFFFYDTVTGKLSVRGECHETVRCTNGRATFDFTMTRTLTGSWRVVALSVGDFQFYKPTTPPPDANPTTPPAPSTGG